MKVHTLFYTITYEIQLKLNKNWCYRFPYWLALRISLGLDGRITRQGRTQFSTHRQRH